MNRLKLKKLNLGCGTSYHDDWVNVDFSETGEGVIAHNLLNGIPFDENEFDVVYHSHVLEHFPKDKAGSFIKECFRVLKPGGIIRVAVPDLEQLVRLYLENFEKALNGDESAEKNYDWLLCEIYDQAVRNKTGGEMLEYFKQDKIENLDFIKKRIGAEIQTIRDYILESEKQPDTPPKKHFIKELFKNKKKTLQKQENLKYIEIGKFRLGGEVHQWMYDRFSLKRLLEQNGFCDIKVKTAFESTITGWNNYNLDTIDGKVRKPDSLFMEAKKC